MRLINLRKSWLIKGPVFLWTKTGLVLGWVNTRLVLTLFFYLIMTPYGLVMRLIRFDPLEKRIEKGRPSYWKVKEEAPFDRSRYEKLF